MLGGHVPLRAPSWIFPRFIDCTKKSLQRTVASVFFRYYSPAELRGVLMNRAVLSVTVSVFVLCAGSASGSEHRTIENWGNDSAFSILKGAHVLYNQNSDDAGVSVNSQNYTSGSSRYDDQGADDFVVPKSKNWTITEVDVTGVYYQGSGPATSENVIFYKDKKGIPGDPVAKGTFNGLGGTGGPDFALVLPGKGLTIKPGRYWVSVIANMSFYPEGNQWGWEVNPVRHGKQAMWRNPQGGFGSCTTWGTIERCADSSGPDFMFALRGSAK